jgi:hypothetical protein
MIRAAFLGHGEVLAYRLSASRCGRRGVTALKAVACVSSLLTITAGLGRGSIGGARGVQTHVLVF